ncbi:MAG: threonine aldolase family protein [Pseudomonadota bacterium]
MNFCSDNTATAHPKILEALARANAGPAMPYGEDETTRRVENRFAALFEHDCAVFLVTTGTAANALALSVLAPPHGAIFCHPDSHINCDECGAPEFYTGGAKLIGVAGAGGKIAAADLETAVNAAGAGVVHHAQPAAVSVSEASEAGTVYTAAELGALGEVARRHQLGLHVDGARFANALAALGGSPAALSWRAGVDALSFGATKNGAFAAEAVVFFDRAKAASLGFRRKRAGQLWSKMRFLAAQFDAYLEGELWLDNARHANRMAGELARGLAAVPGAVLAHEAEANEIFVRLPEAAISGLEADGFKFYRWPGPDPHLVRLVTAFDTDPAHVAAFVDRAAVHAGAARPRAARRRMP